MAILRDIGITHTTANMSNREIATAVIADKLRIKPEEVKDDTPLGTAAHEIAQVLCFKLNRTMVSSSDMTAGDIFRRVAGH